MLISKTVSLYLLVVFFAFILNVDALSQKTKSRSSTTKTTTNFTLDQQAEQQAKAFWTARIIKCEDDFYTRDRMFINQFRNMRIEVKAGTVTPAKRLNGIEWEGSTKVTVQSSRTYSPKRTTWQDAGWSKWSDGFTPDLAGAGLEADLQKVRGQWRVVPRTISQAKVLEPISCQDLKNPMEAYILWKQRKQEEQLDAEVRDFLSRAESYWHVYSEGLPNNLYKFLAKYPNSLRRVVFLPNGGWVAVANFAAVETDKLPNVIAEATNEGGQIDTLAVGTPWIEGLKYIPWVMFKKVEQSERRIPLNYGYKTEKIFRREPMYGNPMTGDSPGFLRKFYDEWKRVDLLRFAHDSEKWVIIYNNYPNYGVKNYHSPGEHNFGYQFSEEMPEKFKDALYDLWNNHEVERINEIAFTTEGGFVIIYNENYYVYENIPEKMVEALKYFKQNKLGKLQGQIAVSIGFTDQWIVFWKG